MSRLMCSCCLLLLFVGCKDASVAQSADAAASNNAPAQSYDSGAKEQLSWVRGANVVSDIDQALSIKDYRLLAYPGRGASIPGVDVTLEGQSPAELERLCGLNYMEGVGDIVFSDEHMVLLKQVYHYAESYNRSMLVHCSNQ